MSTAWTGVIIVVVAMAVESVAQVCLKLGASGTPRFGSHQTAWGSRLGARTWVALGIVAYVVEIALYTAALHFLDVSVAFPLGSLCFVGVTVLSRFVLGESVNRIRWLGVGLIIGGSILVTC